MRKIVPIILLLFMIAIGDSTPSDWSYGVEFEGLKPSYFKIEKNLAKDWIMDIGFNLTFAEENSYAFEVDFLHPSFYNLYAGLGFTYEKSESTYASIPVILAYYKKLGPVVLQFGTKSPGLDLQKKNLTLTTKNLFWVLFFPI